MQIGESYEIENKEKKSITEVICLTYADGKRAYINTLYRFGVIKIEIMNESEIESLIYYKDDDDHFCSDEFSNTEMISLSDEIEKYWEFESDEERNKFEDLFEENESEYSDMLDYLESEHDFNIDSVYFEIQGGIIIEKLLS
jgi:hypothetical protein